MKLFYACVACILLLSPSNKLFSQTFNHTPEWTTSANGILSSLGSSIQIDAMYGYKVTALGDITGDGYADIAVSAPGLAAALGTNSGVAQVGAVFLFRGGLGGIETTPFATLQPSSTVAGALFGFSVAAGDVTGDGTIDLVVGAPLDQATIGLFGTKTVGRIYVYDGDLLVNPNPTPTLTVNLDAGDFSLIPNTANINPLFGFSVAVTGDLNSDNKGEIIVGSPGYARVSLATAVRTGAAYVYMSNGTNFTGAVRHDLAPPTGSLLGLSTIVQGLLGPLWTPPLSTLLDPLLNGQIEGLLFGFSVDGTGDFDNDAIPDIVVGAPAGVDLGVTLDNALSGQILGGTAYIFKGTAGSISTSSATHLQAASTGLLSSAANLFGFSVKGIKNDIGSYTGNIIVGAPSGALIPGLTGGLQVKAGTVSVFQKYTGIPASIPASISANQTLQSPRSTAITSILDGNALNLGIMFGASLDNMQDVNNDGNSDIIVGEPLSTSIGLLNSNLIGGSAHIFLGDGSGTYTTTPDWSLNTTVASGLGLNALPLVGYSVAGAGRTTGTSITRHPVIGAPASALNFSSGVLDLGGTLNTLTSFTTGDNGLGKAFSFNATNTILPVKLVSFTGKKVTTGIQLQWTTSSEINSKFFEVQRSADGASFVKIGQVGATGNSSGSNIDYSFLDPAPLTGPNFYRLRMVDIDGAYEYSSTLLIRLDIGNGNSVIINPNPVTDKLQLSWRNMPAAEYTVDIINPGGKIVKTQKVTVNSSLQTTVIPRESNWGNGLFVVRIRSTKEQFAIKVLLQ